MYVVVANRCQIFVANRYKMNVDRKRSCGGLVDDKFSEGSMCLVVVRTWVWLANRGQVVVGNRKQRTIV